LGTSWEQYGLDVIRGEARGMGATLARWGLAGVAGVYGGVMRVRNVKYDRGLGVRRLPRPVVSVGNLTTGGTGKTPVVRWLCERLREAGGRPAVLMRGYKARPGERGDEQAMLEGLLGDLVVRAGADRYEAGMTVLREHPEVSVFVLDDGFQHRRLGRDFDLVLVDGSEPFGYGRVLPRGLLREPMEGLARADAVLITRADQAKDVEGIVRAVRRVNAGAPVYRCSHAHGGLRGEDEAVWPMEWLAGKRFFAFAGIGNPAGLEGQLRGVAGTMVGRRWCGDRAELSGRRHGAPVAAR